MGLYSSEQQDMYGCVGRYNSLIREGSQGEKAAFTYLLSFVSGLQGLTRWACNDSTVCRAFCGSYCSW